MKPIHLLCAVLTLSLMSIVGPPSTAATIARVHQFAPGNVPIQVGDLVSVGNNIFYGISERGGRYDCGTIYKFRTGSPATVVHSFTMDEGGMPASLTFMTDGNLYGTTDGSYG